MLRKNSRGMTISPFDGKKVRFANNAEATSVLTTRKFELKDTLLWLEKKIKNCTNFEELVKLKSTLTITNITYNETLLILHG